MLREMNFHLQSYASENTDENTAQPVYRLGMPVFLESLVQAGSIPERSDKESFCCDMFPSVSFSMWRASS